MVVVGGLFGGHNTEECRSCPNIATSLGLFINPAQFGIRKRFLSGFITKKALIYGDSHFGGFGSRETKETYTKDRYIPLEDP